MCYFRAFIVATQQQYNWYITLQNEACFHNYGCVNKTNAQVVQHY